MLIVLVARRPDLVVPVMHLTVEQRSLERVRGQRSRVDMPRRLRWRARTSYGTGYPQGLGQGRCRARDGHCTVVTRAEREERPWGPGCSGEETF